MKRGLFVISILLLLLAACLPGRAPSKPTVTIVAPAPGAQLEAGKETVVQATATDKAGILRVELWVDGTLANTVSVPSGQAQPSFLASFTWTPSSPGSHTLEVRAYNVKGAMSAPTAVIVNVTGAVAGVTPPPTSPAATPPPGVPYVVATANVNIRSGPGTAYPVLAVLKAGDRAKVTGKSPDGGWWQVEYPPGTGGRGWVSAAYTTPYNTGGVPEVPPPPLPTPTSAPPTETPVPPTATPVPPTATPVPPTATPTSPPPGPTPTPYISFYADDTSLFAGNCTTLHWDVENVSAVYLDGVGVAGHGSQEVCPDSTTTYTLHVVKPDGSAEDRTVTITVTLIPMTPLLPITPIIITPPIGPTVIYDFVDHMCDATWTSGAGTLPCPGSGSDNKGFVQEVSGWEMEDGSTPSSAIETHPQWVDDGWIQGKFALGTSLQSGDRFKAKIGFLKNASAGNVKFVASCVAPLPGWGDIVLANILEQTKAYNNTLMDIDVEIPAACSSATHIALIVFANGSSAQDWAVWIEPRIERP